MWATRLLAARPATRGKETNNAAAYRDPCVSARDSQAADVYQMEIAVQLLAMAGGVDKLVSIISCGRNWSFKVEILFHIQLSRKNLKACEMVIGTEGGSFWNKSHQ
jgi:hypothetical protein